MCLQKPHTGSWALSPWFCPRLNLSSILSQCQYHLAQVKFSFYLLKVKYLMVIGVGVEDP